MLKKPLNIGEYQMLLKEYKKLLENFPDDMQVLSACGDSVFDGHSPEIGFFVEVPNERVHFKCYVEITDVEYEDWKLDKKTLEHDTPFEPFRALLML